MAELSGVSIVEVTAFGWSEDGQYIWITHKLPDGSEYRLVYPSVAAGQLIAMLIHAAGSANAARVSRDPSEAVGGADSLVMPAAEIRMGTAADGSAAILHVTTSDNIPVAMQLPATLLRELVEQAQKLLAELSRAESDRRLH